MIISKRSSSNGIDLVKPSFSKKIRATKKAKEILQRTTEVKKVQLQQNVWARDNRGAKNGFLVLSLEE
jgi:hypothetical protein